MAVIEVAVEANVAVVVQRMTIAVDAAAAEVIAKCVTAERKLWTFMMTIESGIGMMEVAEKTVEIVVDDTAWTRARHATVTEEGPRIEIAIATVIETVVEAEIVTNGRRAGNVTTRMSEEVEGAAMAVEEKTGAKRCTLLISCTVTVHVLEH